MLTKAFGSIVRFPVPPPFIALCFNINNNLYYLFPHQTPN